MTTLRLATITLLSTAALTWTLAAEPKKPRSQRPKPSEIELTGHLRRPVKWSPQIDLGLVGKIRYFDLSGALLQGVKDGTRIRVKGVVHSRYHRGSTKGNLSPFPPQWIIWLEITELEELTARTK